MTSSAALTVRPLPPHPATIAPAAPDQWPLPLGPTIVEPPSDSRGSALQGRAVHFVRAFVEVVAGDRPLTQLAPWVSAEVYDSIINDVGAAAQHRGRIGASPRPHVASVHVSMVNEQSAEVTARIVRGGRSRALAIRLDLFTDLRDKRHWRCTTLIWVGP